MTCPRCGGPVSPTTRQCPVCSAPDAGGVTVVADWPGDVTVARTIPASGAMFPPSGAGPLAPGQTFGPRYHILKVLGVGGMGAVYQAWDAELAEAVAIKIIRPEAKANPAAAAELEKRFKRELLLARQVTHKNVVRIHDLGEIGGIKYITMSYVDGIDLATVLKQEGALGVERVLGISRAVVAGLQAAHAAGIVHRDLKPGNIMIRNDGEALIMDFGIARSTGGPQELPSPALAGLPLDLQHTVSRLAEATMVGAIVGTVAYMAPEQARGEEVDQRADIYALGLIVYDMLAGTYRASHADSALAELHARMERAPAPINTVASSVPEPLAGLIGRCIEPERDKRFATTDALAEVLDRLDEQGNLRPIRRVVGLPLLASVVVLLLALSAATWWYSRAMAPPPKHDPVSVLIADFRNQTGDAAFDRTLAPVLKIALEGAGFITAYDRTGVGALGGIAPAMLDEQAATALAVKQGVGIVVSGSVASRGDGYDVAVKASQSVTGKVLVAETSRAARREEVLGATSRLATAVRSALGDETSNAQIFAMDTLSATSLEVVRQYAAATQALSDAKYEEAQQGFARSVELDPKFGMGYQGLALVSRNLDRPADAEKYIQEALRHVDGMTERERFRARGFFYRLTGDYPACVKEYGDLVARYAADVAAHNQIALCSTFLRNMPRAVEEMRTTVKIVPQSAILRGNLALYESYSGNFEAGAREASAVQPPRVFGLIALAFGQIGQGQLMEAGQTYDRLAMLNAQGASYAVSGLADLALFEGRYADAARMLVQGIAADLMAGSRDRAAVKQSALGFAYLSAGQRRQAVVAAEQALTNSQTVRSRFLAARAFVDGDRLVEAQRIADALAAELQAEPQAHGKIVQGLILLRRKDYAQTIRTLTEANMLLDTWIGHFDLGRAYLEAGQFIQADSEFDRCLKRRGEAMALFLDEQPTYGYFPAVYYYQGRVREGLKSVGYADSYREYLKVRGASREDPLAADARRRIGA